jgi:3-phenylpropionate/trans-cinnamate dioxygenase ferredoxin reductase component
MVKRVVIVGGGGAGDAAAFALRKKGFDGEVLILSADHNRPYDRPYLSKEYLRSEVELPKVFLHGEEDYSREKIELRLNQRVAGGSLGRRTLKLEGGDEVDFDVLVLGLGGTPRRLPGAPQSDNVLTLRSLRDSQAIRKGLKESSRILLVGAGFIGAEVAASARQLGKEVLMVEAGPVPLSRALGEKVGEVYASIHRSKGVDLRTATKIEKWHTKRDKVQAVTLSDGRREEVDLVVLAVGIDPNLEIPKALGLPIEGGGVSVDEGLKAADGVYCAGDIAFHPHPVLGRAIRVEHWEVAKNQGRAVASAVVDGPAPYRKLPYFWSDQYDVSMEYRGNASGDHQEVWRGDPKSLAFSVFYLREGLIDAVLSMNDKKTNEAGGKLIESRRQVDEAALADPSRDISVLIPAAKA